MSRTTHRNHPLLSVVSLLPLAMLEDVISPVNADLLENKIGPRTLKKSEGPKATRPRRGDVSPGKEPGEMVGSDSKKSGTVPKGQGSLSLCTYFMRDHGVGVEKDEADTLSIHRKLSRPRDRTGGAIG